MDSLLNLSAITPPKPASSYDVPQETRDVRELVIETSLDTDTINVNFKERLKGLTITAREIVKKLNELLADKVPNGVESLSVEDHTPEATASRIVQGVVAFLPAFAKQNPGLSEEEALDKFMETVKGGIQKGYDEAFSILEGLGAFEVDGIKSGVEETKILIDSKLNAFYEVKRSEMRGEPREESAE